MKKLALVSVVAILVATLFALSVWASTAEMYFSLDKNGQNRVTNVQEGSTVWICVYDPDENIDCDVRDKIWTDIKLMDPKTGAYIVWISYMNASGDAKGHGYLDAPTDPNKQLYEPYKGHFPGNAGWLGGDYLEETGADTGLFVSARTFQIGTRADFGSPGTQTHVVDNSFRTGALAGLTWDFQGGNYDFASDLSTNDQTGAGAKRVAYVKNADIIDPTNGVTDNYVSALTAVYTQVRLGFLPAPLGTNGESRVYMIGRFENMDTLIGLYQDPNDDTDVATAMMKIVDTKSTITWDQEIYKDADGSATITVTDPDENLNCNAVEYVPVVILINPGSWNPINFPPTGTGSSPGDWNGSLRRLYPNSFGTLKLTGGVLPKNGSLSPVPAAWGVAGHSRWEPIAWYDAYYSGLKAGTDFTWGSPGVGAKTHDVENNQEEINGAYFIQYPTQAFHDNILHYKNVTYFDTTDADGYCRVSFYAQETGPNTGVFQLNLNSILVDLGFNSLRVRDVLSAYYQDPNDEDDFSLAVAYIESKESSITSFTGATRQDQQLYWLGRDPVYVQVIDSNANVDPCCPEQVLVNLCDPHQEDDWEYVVLDETSSNSPVFFTNSGMELRPVFDPLGVGLPASTGGYQLQLDNWRLEAFNEDQVMVQYNDVYYKTGATGLASLGDSRIDTAAPPEIDRVRVANDVSFDLMSIGDTQVYNGSTTNMYFLDRQGNRVSGYTNSDCVFVEVVDPDQNEDTLRRERVDAFWSGGQNLPFGPWARRDFTCPMPARVPHPFNALLGDTNIFNSGKYADIYVLNPRSGFWAPLDVLETGVGTGDFVSVTCIDLVNVYTCVPTLGALPGDTIVAYYQDPSNHSDSAMISTKVGIGGGGTPPSQASTTTFVNATGVAVNNYTDADLVYVKVVDPSHAGATTLANAVTIGTTTYTVAPLAGATNDTFITTGLNLGLAAGASITATYKDPTDPTDTSSDTITIIASKLDVTSFYAGPNPSAGDVTFAYKGTGIATTMSVEVYDLAGHLVWANELANVTHVVWNGKDDGGALVANGAYIYLVKATDGTDTFSGKGTLFINR